jgi:exodeoxyribonuclease V gamma subunit
VTLDLRIASRPEPLIDVLADWLSEPTADPFAFDLVVVPNAGMREWAGAALIDRLGLLSNVEFVFPGELTRRSLGLPAPADDPWRPERLAWHVLALMAEGADLGRTPWRGLPERPWSVARRVADLLERYATQRPDLIGAWVTGEQGAAGGAATVGSAHGWQAVTWSAVRGRVGMPSSAEALLAALGSGMDAGARAPVGTLPARLAVLGLSSLSAPAAAVLAHASLVSDVLVLATAASTAALPGRAAGRTEPEGSSLRDLLVAPDRPRDVELRTHPLLLTWGRPALEAAAMLARLPVEPTLLERATSGATSGATSAGRAQPSTQLGVLQAAVRDGEPSGTDGLDRGRDGDGSIQVHACHGLVRQLEVLRDAILHAMEADPTLLPRDIAVLCTDLEAVAPLAVPILGADVAGRHLPVLVTDRAATTTPPVQAALDAALALSTSRLERDEVITFLSLPVVSAALGLDADDLSLLERMADLLDVRWGQDGEHRQRWGYPSAVTIGTWREALDRLLAGLLVDSEGQLVGGLAPAVGVGTQDLGRIGRLADALASVGHLAALAEQPLPMVDWAVPLRWLVDTLLRPHRAVDAAGHAFATQAAQVRQAVDELLDDATAAGVTLAMDVREIRAALADRMASGGSRARLRTGHISVASLAPLRGVPFRLIAVVGIDDVMLSSARGDDDDVLALAPRLGERDAADERRAALLDAVLAARDTLIVTCDGQDVRTGRTLDLPTVVEELLDAVPAPGRAPAPDEPGIPLVVRHPRHLADRRNLTRGPASLPRVDRERAWTFVPAARRALEALEAAEGAGAPGVGVLTEPVPAPDGTPDAASDRRWRGVMLPGAHDRDGVERTDTDGIVQLRLEDVVESLRSPARVLLRERLGLRLPRDLASAPRPIELWVDDHVARWGIGEGLLEHLVAGGTADGWLAVRPAHGGVPPGALGRAFLAGFIAEVEELHVLAERPVRSVPVAAAGDGVLLEHLPVSVELDVRSAALGTRRVRLVGSLPHVAGLHVDVSYSRDHPSALLRAGIGLLAATAQGHRDGGTDVVGARVVRRAAAEGAAAGRRDLTVRGAEAAERSEVARAALGRLVDLALRVRSGAAPLLRRSAWSIDGGTDIARPPRRPLATDVERDLSDLATQVVLGVTALADLADQVDGPLEEGLPAAPTPVQRWSLALREAFTDAFEDLGASAAEGQDAGQDATDEEPS